MDNLLLQIFCDVDDFCILYEQHTHKLLYDTDEKIQKCRITKNTRLSLSEVMTIIIYFHFSDYRKFKNYYKKHVCRYLRDEFPNLVSYNRFVELMSDTIIPLMVFTNTSRLGKHTGIYFIDSTPLPVCHNKRIYSNKVFEGIANRGKTSTGWFYGFKLHIVANDMGEIVSFYLSSGNVDDRNLSVIDELTKDIHGKMCGDRGYISQKLFEHLYFKGIQLITRLKKNMKPKLSRIEDQIMLRKRAIIECVNDFLKNICNVDHTRHRKPLNFLVNLVSGLCAYSYLPKKPSLKIQRHLEIVA
jgi:hypothetical protein